MASAGSIFVDLLLKDSQYSAGLNRARKSTKDAATSFKRDLGSAQLSFASLTGAAGQLAATLGVGFSLAGIAKAADEVALLSARLQQSTQSAAEFDQAFAALSKQAIEIGTNLSNGVEIFQRLSFSRKEIDATNEEMIAFVETVQKLGAVSGASGTALSAGLLQLGQGLSAGILRAEEFNSIMENIPAIGKAIAEEFGVSVGQLRQLVIAGEVLSKDVMTAILRQQQEAAEQFAKLPITIERGFNSLTQGVALFAAELNKTAGITSGIGENLQFIGRVLSENTQIARGFGEALSGAFDALVTTFGVVGLSLQGPTEGESNLKTFLEDRIKTAKQGKELFTSLADSQQELNGYLEDADLLDYFNSIPEASKKAENAFSKDYAKIAATLSDDKKSKKGENAIERWLVKQREALETLRQESELIGLTTIEVEKLTDARNFEAMIAERSVGLKGAQLENFRREAEAIAAARQELIEYNYEASRSAEAGVKDFFAEYTEDATNAAENIKGVLQDAFKGAEDALVEFVKTGKLNFKELASSIIEDLLRIQIRKQLAGVIDAVSGGFGNILGSFLGGGGSAASFSAGGIPIPPSKPAFFADGGFLGPGQFGIAGEAGAELLYGGKTGVSVFNQDQMGRKGNTYHIDARGADQGAVQRLEGALLALAGPGVIEARVSSAQQRGAL